LKNQDPIKGKKPISNFEQKANIILIVVAIVILSAIALGVYLTIEKPAKKISQKIETPLKVQQDVNSSKVLAPSPKVEQKAVPQKVEEMPKVQENQKVQQNQKKENDDLTNQKIVTVNIKTSKGDINVELYPDLMPITVENFVELVKKNFYNGLTFHRVENWVIQGGDPKGNGTGGSDKTIKLETNANIKNVRGAIAMARSMDRDSASSQFYILKQDASWLDNDYAVFGKVVTGMDVVDKIAIGDKMAEVKEIK